MSRTDSITALLRRRWTAISTDDSRRPKTILPNELCGLPEQSAGAQRKKKAVRHKLRADRKPFLHTVEEIMERPLCCMDKFKNRKVPEK